MRGILVICLAFIIVVTVFTLDARRQRDSSLPKEESPQSSMKQEEVQAYLLPEAGGSNHNGLILVALGVVFLALGTMCPED